MFVHKSRPLSGLGAQMLPLVICWDGKTKVVNDRDCPPKPAPAPTVTIQTTPAPAPVSMAQPVPQLYQVPAPAPTVQPPAAIKVAPPPAIAENIPQVNSGSNSASVDYSLVPLPATGGSGQAQAGVVETEAPPVVAEKKSWIPLAVALLSLYNFA